MARNRSLDDFIDAESGSDTDGDHETDPDPASDPDSDANAGTESDADADTASDTPDEPSEPTPAPEPATAPAPASGLDAGPARSTMAWDPDGAACEACGTDVERRWRADDALVCDGCKEW